MVFIPAVEYWNISIPSRVLQASAELPHQKMCVLFIWKRLQGVPWGIGWGLLHEHGSEALCEGSFGPSTNGVGWPHQTRTSRCPEAAGMRVTSKSGFRVLDWKRVDCPLQFGGGVQV